MALQLPSASNTTGTVLGTLAGGLVTATASSWPFVITAAAAMGATPAGLAALLGVATTAGVGYLVTHVAEVKNLNDFVAAWWPQIKTYPVYPTGKNGQ